MNRRDTFKALLLGSISSGLILSSCKQEEDLVDEIGSIENHGLYGRTPEELDRDARLKAEGPYFTAEESALLAVLSNIIIPAENDFPKATDTGVVEFIDFIMRDMPHYALPMRGGLAWINREAHTRFSKNFVDLSESEQIQIVDDIAYPLLTEQDQNSRGHLSSGIEAFNLIRNLVGTGYFTSKEGLKDIGYAGNYPTFWDGIPQEVLDEYGLSYDEQTLALAAPPEKQHVVVEWDENKNIIN